MYGGADAMIGAAAADISVHGFIDVVVAGGADLSEKACRRHDLPGLAIAALGHVVFDPSLGHRRANFVLQTFYCGDLSARAIANLHLARPDAFTIKMDRAGTTQSRTTTKFRAG